MEIPEILVSVLTVFLSGLVTYLVVAGIKGIGSAFGKDLSNFAKNVAALASAAVVTFAFGVIDLALVNVPEAYVPVVSSLLTVLANWLTAAGIQRETKKKVLG